MPRLNRHSKLTTLVATLSLLAGCAPGPSRVPTPTKAAPASTDGTVVVGSTTTTTGGSQPTVGTTLPGVTQNITPIEVKPPIISNNGAAVIHGSVRIPASIISPNGANIVSPNGGNIVSPNGGNIVSPNGGNIVSPNGGNIVSPNGGNIVSPNGGNIVSPNGGNIVSPNGGNIVSNNGSGFKVSQVPMRFAEVKLTDAAGTPVKDDAGKEVKTTTDAEGNYAFPVNVTGRNLVVRVAVPGQSDSLLGLVSKDGASRAASVDINSTMSMSYILQKYVDGDVSRFERLETKSFDDAVVQTDTTLADGKIPLPKTLSADELTKKVEQIRLQSESANTIFTDIRRQLIPAGITNQGDGLNALTVNLGELSGATRGLDGSLYIFSRMRHNLWKLDKSGLIHTILLGSTWGYPEASGTVFPILLSGMAVDKQGFLYIADTHNNRIVRVSPDKEIITIAGNGKAGFTGDGGQAVDATINQPTGLVLDAAGTLTFSDTGNKRIRRILKDGTISTIAGDGNDGEELDDRIPGGAHLLKSQGLALGTDGTLFVADGGHHRILELTPANKLSRVFNDPVKLQDPVNLSVRGKDLVILDSMSARPYLIRKGVDAGVQWANSFEKVDSVPFDPTSSCILYTGATSTVIGSGGQYIYEGDFGGDFKKIFGVNLQDADNILDRATYMDIDAAGNIFISDPPSGRIYRQQAGGLLAPVAGMRDVRDLDEADHPDALTAHLKDPQGVLVDPKTGELLVAVNSTIRRLTKAGALVVERKGFSTMVKGSDGQDKTISFEAQEMLLTKTGDFYIAGLRGDTGSGILVRALPDGTYKTVTGTAQLQRVQSLCQDEAGTVYFLDGFGQTIYKVVADGLVPILEVDTKLGDRLGKRNSRAFVRDPKGNIFITDGFQLFCVLADTKAVVTVAGEGGKYFAGSTRDTSINYIEYMRLTDNGDLYLVDRDQVKLLRADQLRAVL